MIWGCKLPDLGLRITSICVPMWTSLAAHWLIICASTAGVQVLSLVGELRSCMLCGAANKKKRCVSMCLSFHGQRSLMRHRPWGHKELDTAERLTLSLLGLP